MLIDHNFSANGDSARGAEARSIGSIINDLREVAVLRDKVRQDRNFLNFAASARSARPLRVRALRRNSA